MPNHLGKGEDHFDYEDFLNEVLRLEEKYSGFFVNDPDMGLKSNLDNDINCGAGHRSITIAFDRSIKPCVLNHPQFC